MTLKNKDIVFVSNALANGGAARVMCVLAREFAAQGMEVGIAVFNPFGGEYDLPESVDKEYGPAGAGAKVKGQRIAWLRRIAKRNPDAVIIAFEYFVNMQTLVACMGLRNRVVVSERNDPARVGSNYDWARERLYRRADMLVCQTYEAAAHFSNKVTKCVIPNPVKEGLPEPFEGERRKTVVTFCRLEPQKNLGMLLRAFATFSDSHADWTLEIYGDGSEREALWALAGDLGVANKVSINCGRQDVHDVVRDAGMFVLPSDYEGFSNSILEAMAIGLPVICTDCPCGGARMVVEDGENGLLVPVGDEAALADAIGRIAANPTLADKLSRNAADLRERLSASKVCSKWMQVIDRGE